MEADERILLVMAMPLLFCVYGNDYILIIREMRILFSNYHTTHGVLTFHEILNLFDITTILMITILI